MSRIRRLAHLIPGLPASDGAGVRLFRSIGSRRGLFVDPFLMLDEFGTENPDDYIAGFPSHPHRGFETVTYMLDGHMQHRDNQGNCGDLKPGDVQWMTAARGIVHSEMPQQTEGRMRGFQLWVNLPAIDKMIDPSWQDIPAARIPKVALPEGGEAVVIAGRFPLGEGVTGPAPTGKTEVLYWDLHLPAGKTLDLPVPEGHQLFCYIYEGEVSVGEDAQHLPHRHAAVLVDGDTVRFRAGAGGEARLLLIGGKPIGEPVVQYGPFVMNTREEIEQAIRDFQSGAFA